MDDPADPNAPDPITPKPGTAAEPPESATAADPSARGERAAASREAAASDGAAASERATASPGDAQPPPQGPGCLPAVIAATLLMGMVFFIAFGFSAWLIFQKRGDLAVRTLRGTIIPELQQSRLDPEEKREVIQQLTDLADDLDQGMYENWQAGGIMQRLITSPMMRWGDLLAVDQWAAKNLPPEQRRDARKEISRFFRAIELDRVVARDIHDVLAPVSLQEDAMGFVQLRSDLREADVREVVQRAKLIADRAQVPDQEFDPISLSHFIRRQIEVGSREGAA